MKVKKLYTKLKLITFFLIIGGVGKAQPFDGTKYGNHWINTSQKYVRLAVKATGLQRVALNSLPAGFPINQIDKFHLYHRGKEVSIINVSNSELVFYGVVNDGSSDSLFYRPMSSRLNPHCSFYSDEGAYFLTVDSSTPTKKTELIDQPLSGQPLSYHMQTDLKVFNASYSQSVAAINAPLLQSFFQNGVSWTSRNYVGDTTASFSFELKDFVPDVKIAPVMDMLLHGRNNLSQNIRMSIGRSSSTLRLANTLSFTGLVGYKTQLKLEGNDFDSNGKGVMTLKSTIVTSETHSTGRYSVAYYKFTYPQRFNMSGLGSYTFQLPGNEEQWSRVRIANSVSGTRLFDVTIPEAPVEIKTQIIDGNLEGMVPRLKNKVTILYATSTSDVISEITNAPMAVIEPDQFDYLIITTSGLISAAEKYRDYRKSNEGGNYKAIVVDIKDLYNQFNYGEQSPVAIRRFVDFMVSSKDIEKYVLLIGPATTVFEGMIKNLPDQVPAVGYPGSDLLMVEGLAGVPRDVPTIPIGRLSAKTPQEVLNYLEKVKAYESEGSDNLWKKRVLHLSGGKTAAELTQLKNALTSLVPVATSGRVGGNVETFVKKSTALTEVADISSSVNEGVGMITYFGHGSQTVTDFDMGYISAAERGYLNSGKYSFMYFNGCGVGNIFAGLQSATLAEDWLMTPEKGAVAIMANSYFSYYSPTYSYLKKLYERVFVNESYSHSTLGQVLIGVSKEIMANNPNAYDIANLHQSLLQGDPALHVIQLDKPDFSLEGSKKLFLKARKLNGRIDDPDSLQIGVVATNAGRYISGQKVTVQLDKYYVNSTMDSQRLTIPTMAYRDTLFIPVSNRNDLSGIKVTFDPENDIEELIEDNNDQYLSINWDVAKSEYIYWGETIIDVVSPRLRVYFDNREIRNNEIVRPNPIISISMEDDNLLTSDTTRIDVFLKPCGVEEACSFVKVPYGRGEGGSLVISSVSGNQLRAVYSPELLNSGDYELLVNSRDLVGNPVSQLYRIAFTVFDQPRDLKVIVSPNPATSYVRFETDFYDTEEIKSIDYLIFNSTGIQIRADKVKTINRGVNEWYWYPEVGSGLYLYRVILRKEDESEQVVSGKILFMR